MKKILVLLFILSVNMNNTCITPKIIGLMQVRNESPIIEVALRAMAVYTDSIVVLDDDSADNTVAIIKSLSKELNIEKIIEKKECAWFYKTELDSKQELLNAARSLGGTHFIHLDADEILTSNCAKDNWLRKKILALDRGQVLVLRMIHPWKGVDYYRDDEHMTPNKLGIGAFMHDDGVCSMKDNKNTSSSGFIHIGRFPVTKNIVSINDVEHCIIHFKFVNFEDMRIKIAWYMCLERIRLIENLSLKHPNRTIENINKYYSYYQPFFEDEHIVLRPMRNTWLNYKFFNPDVFHKQHIWRKKEIRNWFKKHGISYFKKLNIWNLGINWKNF
ncbi:MAG: glycosyltransferase family 2 protein [Candidatus Babeliales bacterium]|nr:glycosyltransferase family 2 protein [Candidatus Babeliales bacterium]